MKKYRERMRTFTIEDIPELDVAVRAALELFETEPLPELNFHMYQRPLVVGSGNAAAVGRVLFSGRDAVFASESTYERALRGDAEIDSVVLISASGAKHAPGIAQHAREEGKHVMLLTNTPDAPASEYADTAIVLPKNREPYSYNVSTYLGMLLADSREDPRAIHSFLADELAGMDMPDFGKFARIVFIIPSVLSGGIEAMLQQKCAELFGRHIARDIVTEESIKHGAMIVESDELIVSIGYENSEWGETARRLNIPLPAGAGPAALMSVAYYIIGLIQKAHPPYFKESIVAYTARADALFGHTMKPIVE